MFDVINITSKVAKFIAVLSAGTFFAGASYSYAQPEANSYRSNDLVVANVDEVSHVSYSTNLSLADKLYQRDRSTFDFSKKYTLTCSIFSFYRDGLLPKVHFYSTYRVDHCSSRQLASITAASAKAQLKTIDDPSYVKVSVPRVQLMDINFSPMAQHFFAIGPLDFALIASARLGIRNVLSAILGHDIFSQYDPIEITSNDHFIWHSGSAVYTLTGPDGVTYVMTHAAVRDPIKSESELENRLGDFPARVSIPNGWLYRKTILNRDYVVFTDSRQYSGRKYLMDSDLNVYIESPNIFN